MTSTTVNADPAQTTEQQDMVEMLDMELARLPSKYRTPLILCQPHANWAVLSAPFPADWPEARNCSRNG
jgi:hypothetical protein